MWPNPQSEEILNGKLHFLCDVRDPARGKKIKTCQKNCIYLYSRITDTDSL